MLQNHTVRDQERVIVQYVLSGRSPCPMALHLQEEKGREEEAWGERRKQWGEWKRRSN